MRLECIFCHFPKYFCTCPCVPNSRLEPQHVIARNAGDFCRIPRQSHRVYSLIAAGLDLENEYRSKTVFAVLGSVKCNIASKYKS
jgi:hypothetical protein